MNAKEFKEFLLNKAKEVQDLIDSGEWLPESEVIVECYNGGSEIYRTAEPGDLLSDFNTFEMTKETFNHHSDYENDSNLIEDYSLEDFENKKYVLIITNELF